MFSASLTNTIADAAAEAGLEKAALLALVEVETSGAPFEADGRTPTLLYERHKAWANAAKVSKALQAAFGRAGLAIARWSPSTQYKDQGSSAGRLALIAKARSISEEVANQSASWGLGQTLGSNYETLGYASACAMVDHLTGNVPAQIDCLITFLKGRQLVEPLNAHEWTTVARGYNGPGYAANRYDVRLADAYKRWVRRQGAGAAAVTAPDDLDAEDIEALQRKLRKLGYASAGNPDGRFGVKTVGALSQFQAHEGLVVTGKFDDATKAALKTAQPIEPPAERQRATANGLRAAGSRTIVATDRGSLFAWAKGAGGVVLTGGGAIEKMGLLDKAQEGIDTANQAKSIWAAFLDLVHPIFAGPAPILVGLVLIGAGVGTWFLFEKIKAFRVADHATGVHAGPVGE
ncbi:MAG: N-acetylmuramidase domain-containing protein [Bradyrhizobium sp.]